MDIIISYWFIDMLTNGSEQHLSLCLADRLPDQPVDGSPYFLLNKGINGPGQIALQGLQSSLVAQDVVR